MVDWVAMVKLGVYFWPESAVSFLTGLEERQQLVSMMKVTLGLILVVALWAVEAKSKVQTQSWHCKKDEKLTMSS